MQALYPWAVQSLAWLGNHWTRKYDPIGPEGGQSSMNGLDLIAGKTGLEKKGEFGTCHMIHI